MKKESLPRKDPTHEHAKLAEFRELFVSLPLWQRLVLEIHLGIPIEVNERVIGGTSFSLSEVSHILQIPPERVEKLYQQAKLTLKKRADDRGITLTS